jgi:hypothetical protein
VATPRAHGQTHENERRAKVRPVDADELTQFLVAAEKHEPRYSPAFLLLARTGMLPAKDLALR